MFVRAMVVGSAPFERVTVATATVARSRARRRIFMYDRPAAGMTG